MKLLTDAGLEAISRLKEPIQPHMFVVLPRPKLKQLLFKGIQLMQQEQAEAQMRSR